MNLKPVDHLNYNEKLDELYSHVHNDYCTNHNRLLHLLVGIVQTQANEIDDLHRLIHDLTPM